MAPSTMVTSMVVLLAPFFSKLRIHSMAVTQSWAVHLAFSLPSMSTQVTSSRSSKVQVLPSSLPHFVATAGCSLP